MRRTRVQPAGGVSNAVLGLNPTAATIRSFGLVAAGTGRVSVNVPEGAEPVEAPWTVMPEALLNDSSRCASVHRISAFGTSPRPCAMDCDTGAAPVALRKLPTLNPVPPANCTTNQLASAAARVLLRSSGTRRVASEAVNEATPGTSLAAYALRPMLCPPACTGQNAIARVRSTWTIERVTWAVPDARLSVPACTLLPSFNSTTCQAISFIASGVPEMLRSKARVLGLSNCARSTRAPMSVPEPVVVNDDSRNDRPVVTGVGSVNDADSAVPGKLVLPRCTLMSAALVNSTTCQSTAWLLAALPVRNCRFVVLV